MEVSGTFPSEALDELVRGLVDHGLVHRRGRGPGAEWQLSAAARQRLDQLVQPGDPAPEELVYLDRRCAVCRRRGLTRLREGVFVCDACEERRVGGEVEPPVEPAASAARRSRRWRHARPVEGEGPLAS